jgi:hypothetical protein
MLDFSVSSYPTTTHIIHTPSETTDVNLIQCQSFVFGPGSSALFIFPCDPFFIYKTHSPVFGSLCPLNCVWLPGHEALNHRSSSENSCKIFVLSPFLSVSQFRPLAFCKVVNLGCRNCTLCLYVKHAVSTKYS